MTQFEWVGVLDLDVSPYVLPLQWMLNGRKRATELLGCSNSDERKESTMAPMNAGYLAFRPNASAYHDLLALLRSPPHPARNASNWDSAFDMWARDEALLEREHASKAAGCGIPGSSLAGRFLAFQVPSRLDEDVARCRHRPRAALLLLCDPALSSDSHVSVQLHGSWLDGERQDVPLPRRAEAVAARRVPQRFVGERAFQAALLRVGERDRRMAQAECHAVPRRTWRSAVPHPAQLGVRGPDRASAIDAARGARALRFDRFPVRAALCRRAPHGYRR